MLLYRFLQDDVFLETATCFNWQTQFMSILCACTVIMLRKTSLDLVQF